MPALTRPNTWVSIDPTGTTQLVYALQTNPAPLTVSLPGQTPQLGSLEFVVTNPGDDAIDVDSITFTLQAGTSGTSLTPTTAGILSQVSDTADWIVVASSAVTSGPADYVLTAAAGSSATLAGGASVVVQLYEIPTVQVPGTTTVSVTEAIDGSDPAYASFSLTTFPYGFYFNGLAATAPLGSALMPVAQVASGDSVVLVWNASVVDTSAYTILWSSATGGQQSATPSELGMWPSPALTSDTVFTVSVTVTTTGGQPLTQSLSTVVSVQNPALVAASLVTGGAQAISGQDLVANDVTINDTLAVGSVNVSGAANVGGAVLAQSLITTNDIWGSGASLHIGTGESVRFELNPGTLSVGAPGELQVDAVGVPMGRLRVTDGGLVGINNTNPQYTLDVAGDINASETVTAGTVTAGTMTATAGLVANGATVQLIAGSSLLQAGTYTTYTDGFAIGIVGWPSSTSPGCVGYANVSANGMSVWATGGNLGAFGPNWSDYQASNGNMCILPVACGSQLTLTASQATGSLQQANAIISFYWVPLGVNGPDAPQPLVRIGDAPELEIPEAFLRPDRDAARGELVAVLEELHGAPLGAELKERLLGALQAL
jgi:hypothetical protein